MRKGLGEIQHNCMIKVYPDGTLRGSVADKPIYRERGYERADKWGPESSRSAKRDKAAEDLERSRRRARAAVYDIAASNDMPIFVTLTLDAARVDRYDMAEITKKLKVWLNNQVQRRGLKYVLVPEHHKDGAIHFHGLFSDSLELTDSGTLKMVGQRPRMPRSAAQRREWVDAGAETCYNIPSYTLGYTTAFRLTGERSKALGYVCKYIGKDAEKLGGRWYLSGGALARPEVRWCDVDIKEGSRDPDYEIKRLGAKIWTFGEEQLT